MKDKYKLICIFPNIHKMCADFLTKKIQKKNFSKKKMKKK